MGLLACAAGIFATLGGASPTGLWLVDFIYVGIAGAALALSGGRSRRTTWLMTAVATLWLAPTTSARLITLVALGVGVHAARTRRRRASGAAIGMLLAFVLGDLGAGPFHGSTTLFVVAAALPMAASAMVHLPPSRRRAIGIAGSLWGASALLATVIFVSATLFAIGDVSEGVTAAEQGFRLARDGEQDQAAARLDESSAHFDDARRLVSGFWALPARLVPILGQHARAVQVVTSEGVSLTEIAAATTRSFDPDDLRLIAGRIDLDVIEDLVPALDRAERALVRAAARIADANTPWLMGSVETQLDELLTELDHARPAAHTATLAAREVPVMLGSNGPVHWLIALTTPAEARGLGGLLGNWILVWADDGLLSIVEAGRNEDINNRLRAIDAELRGPEQYLDRWGKFTPEVFFQDVTLSPDLPMVAEVTADLFDQAKGVEVDGVIILDPFAIGGLLDLTGPVQTSDVRLTADNVASFILEDQYLRYDDELTRVLVLEQLVQGTFAAFTSGALPGPNVVAAELGPIVAQDRIGFWWRSGAGPRELIDRTGLDGRFPDADGGDLLAVVHQNAGQNKLDVYLKRQVEYDLLIDDGQGTATITITLSNDVPNLDLPLTVIGNNDQGYPLGTNVARVTVHTALELRGARLDGDVLGVERTAAFGHDAITALIEIPPGEQRVLEVDVAGFLDLGSGNYRITLPLQPLVNADLISVRTVIDGVENVIADDLRLTQDTVLGPGAD